MTRPRKAGSATRSSSTAMGIMQKLWTKPATNRTTSPHSGVSIQEKTRLRQNHSDGADQHGAGRPDAGAVRGDDDRTGERAGREAGDQPAQAGLAEAVDVLGDIGQQRADQRIGREVHQEGQQHHRAHVRRRPDVGEALAQRAQRRGMGRLLAQHAQAPDADIEREREARGIEERRPRGRPGPIPALPPGPRPRGRRPRGPNRRSCATRPWPASGSRTAWSRRPGDCAA